MATEAPSDTGTAALLIAFGGPEKPEEILPFLQRTTRGRPVPEERLLEVAEHYRRIGGRSPLNELTFRQAAALRQELADLGRPLPVYVGMRNWHPLLVDTLKKMQAEGVRRAAGLILAPHACDSSWEQYKRNVADALAEAALSLEVEYPDPVFDHPGFLEAVAGRVSECMRRLPPGDRADAFLLFTAHSIPTRDPQRSMYAQQLNQSCRRVAEALQHNRWQLSYQSRSGRPQDPWLEPDVNDALRSLAARGVKSVVVVPIGFLCDHVEVLYDLDTEAAETAKQAGIAMLRAKTVGDDPRFIQALADRALDCLG